MSRFFIVHKGKAAIHVNRNAFSEGSYRNGDYMYSFFSEQWYQAIPYVPNDPRSPCFFEEIGEGMVPAEYRTIFLLLT